MRSLRLSFPDITLLQIIFQRGRTLLNEGAIDMTTSQFLDAAQRIGDHNAEINRLLSEIRGALTAAQTEGLGALDGAIQPLDQIEDILRGQLKAYVFHAGDAGGVLAAGAGRDQEEARLDAMVRMRQRAQAASKDGLFLISHLPRPYQELYMALAQSSAMPIYNKPIERTSDLVTTWPDGYFSVETSIVSSTIQTDRNILNRIVSFLPLTGRDTLVHAPVFAVMKAARECGLRLDRELDPRMVDWAEVSMDIDRELLGLDDVHAKEDVPRDVASNSAAYPAGDKNVQAPAPVQASTVKLREVPAHIQAVLQECVVNDAGVLQLPPRQLDAALYQEVKKVLSQVEAKWSKKHEGFVFKLNNARAVLGGLVGDGKFVAVKDFGFFPTPDHLVDEMLVHAGLEQGMSVLEPSAGRGAIALRAAEVVGKEKLTVFELYEENAKILRDHGFQEVVPQDFLEVAPEPKFDLVLMNPPFTRGIDVAHVMHAARFLKPDGRLVAIMSTGWEGGKNKAASSFREFLSDTEGVVLPIAAGEFKESGTNVPTRLVVMDAQNFPWNREAMIPAISPR